MKPKHLPSQLTHLVYELIEALGDVIKECEGEKSYELVELIRLKTLAFRSDRNVKYDSKLDQLFEYIKKLSAKKQSFIGRAFTLKLELINAAEAAYRSYRLRSKDLDIDTKTPIALTFVITAHPTEARSRENIEVFSQIQNLCLKKLENDHFRHDFIVDVKNWIKLAWLLPITKHEKPRVEDEALHLFSLILKKDILRTLISTNRKTPGPIRIRSWVGGDKDGHPGVDHKVLSNTLQLAREHFVHFIEDEIEEINWVFKAIKNPLLDKKLKELCASLNKIQVVKEADGGRVRSFKATLRELHGLYKKTTRSNLMNLDDLLSLVDIFPGLVIPLELREESTVIHEALSKKKSFPIENMLKTLQKTAKGGEITCYAQELVISMTETLDDLKAGIKLVSLYDKTKSLPVAPLFETQTALDNAPQIMHDFFKIKSFHQLVKSKWSGKFEVMLGYSDSSKGMGVMASRVSIAHSMNKLEKMIKKFHITPVFFHGSGGSVDRGGGPIGEQTSWWPKSALQNYKATIQGEMVERTFSSPSITSSNMLKIANNLTNNNSKNKKIAPLLVDFSLSVANCYQDALKSADFCDIVEKATSYQYLSELKFGSRPSKRRASLDFSTIRAIPWVLCWTQTRILFPTWWGVGTTWKEFKKDPKKVTELKRIYNNGALMKSFVNALGFALTKVELPIWNLYIEKSKLSPTQKEWAKKEFQKEYKLALDFVRKISGEKNLLWMRPWLKESIGLRSPSIHPLNILQIVAIQKQDMGLFRQSVAGIAVGMMTTG